MIDTSDEACAVACMLVSNPQDALRKDGTGWQKRVNDLIRALRDERNTLTGRAAMTMTAEERAERFMGGLLSRQVSRDEVVALIRAAENDAIERAAAHLEARAVKLREGLYDPVVTDAVKAMWRSMISEMELAAAAIRALKQETRG